MAAAGVAGVHRLGQLGLELRGAQEAVPEVVFIQQLRGQPEARDLVADAAEARDLSPLEVLVGVAAVAAVVRPPRGMVPVAIPFGAAAAAAAVPIRVHPLLEGHLYSVGLVAREPKTPRRQRQEHSRPAAVVDQKRRTQEKAATEKP
jgi:hypothetical protein